MFERFSLPNTGNTERSKCGTLGQSLCNLSFLISWTIDYVARKVAPWQNAYIVSQT